MKIVWLDETCEVDYVDTKFNDLEIDCYENKDCRGRMHRTI